jgi:hypothetical protein
MAELSVRELVRHTRAVLQRKGPVGAFLLAELDASISRGIEGAPPEKYTDQDDETNSRVDTALGGNSGRRILNEEELLEILVSVLQTYLVTLPAVTDSLTEYLRNRHDIDQVRITLDPSLLNEDGRRAGQVSLEEIAPRLADKAAKDAVRELCEIVSKLAVEE